ncbi:RT0821/Lpp0805 family surface protein [Thiolapillus sp.]
MNRQFPFFILLCVFVSVAQASNWQWLRNTGLESLSDADWNMLSETLHSALESAPDGNTVTWKNPASGNHGSIRMLTNSPSQDSNCRKVQLTTETTAKREGEPLTFCRSAEGNWLIAPSSPAKGKAK